MDKEDPEATKEQSIWLSRILDTNNKKADLEQKVIKLIHLTKFQRVILLSCLKWYKYLFHGNLGEWTGPSVDIRTKYKVKPYHARAFPVLVIHLEAIKNILLD